MSLRSKGYSAADVSDALRNVGIGKGDIVFSHISLSGLGIALGCRNTFETCSSLLAGVREAIGEEGTFVVPTYSYSFTKSEEYNPLATKSEVGPFSDFFLTRSETLRSTDPIFSVCAEGPYAEKLLSGLSHSCFGINSIYDRLWANNAKIVNFGLTIKHLAFIHYIEEEFDVPYRYIKGFSGQVVKGESSKNEIWKYYVRKQCDNTFLNLNKFRDEAISAGLLKIFPLGRGNLEAASCVDLKSIGLNELEKDIWSFVVGPAFE